MNFTLWAMKDTHCINLKFSGIPDVFVLDRPNFLSIAASGNSFIFSNSRCFSHLLQTSWVLLLLDLHSLITISQWRKRPICSAAGEAVWSPWGWTQSESLGDADRFVLSGLLWFDADIIHQFLSTPQRHCEKNASLQKSCKTSIARFLLL